MLYQARLNSLKFKPAILLLETEIEEDREMEERLKGN